MKPVALVDVGITEWRQTSSPLSAPPSPVALVDVGITEWRATYEEQCGGLRGVALVDVGITEWRKAKDVTCDTQLRLHSLMLALPNGGTGGGFSHREDYCCTR